MKESHEKQARSPEGYDVFIPAFYSLLYTLPHLSNGSNLGRVSFGLFLVQW